jgi:type IV secretion system protein VirD4
MQIGIYIFTALVGTVFGLLLSERAKPIRRYLWWGFIGLIFLVSFMAPFPINGGLTWIVAFFLFFAAIGFGIQLGRNEGDGQARVTFGSAKWATADHVSARGLVGMEGLVLGYFPSRSDEETPLPLHYTGDRHLLTVAPTRAGKGVAAIIPNLLSYRGSLLCIDPKGENAMISALRRGPGDKARKIEGLGQAVHIVDPWGLTTEVTGIEPSCFNPLDWLDPDSPEVGENAMMLADALIVTPGGNADPFWSEEAKALIMGFILYVVTSPDEAENRHLGRVRDLLMLNPAQFDELLEAMFNSPNEIVAKSAARLAGKEPKLKSSVLSSAQAQTHFLDSPILRASLSRSDFRFEDLKEKPTTVYLVLPADRLEPFGRWLRLLIQQAITVTARNITVRPARPILFMLDEMAALGRLTMVEQAYGLMAGFGMQLWGIVQDLSQLHRVYGDGWQTFIGNSGVLQYFGSRDKMTAEYFSDLCGVSTVQTLSSSISRAFSSSAQGGSSSVTTSHNHGETQRKLIMPDELMRVASSVQLLLVENLDPIGGWKSNWFDDARFRGLGVNLRNVSPPPPAASPGSTGSDPETDLQTAA